MHQITKYSKAPTAIPKLIDTKIGFGWAIENSERETKQEILREIKRCPILKTWKFVKWEIFKKHCFAILEYEILH